MCWPLIVNLPRERYQDGARMTAFFTAVLERAAGIAGCALSGRQSEQMPLSGELGSTDFRIEGRPEPAPNQEPQAQYGAVSPDYFQALGIRLVAGRGFSRGGRSSRIRQSPSSARRPRSRYWPGESAVGKRLALSTEVTRLQRQWAASPRLLLRDAGDRRCSERCEERRASPPRQRPRFISRSPSVRRET